MKEKTAKLSTRMGRMLKWSFTSFWRNRLLSLASILVIIITLLTVSVFGILNIAINKAVETVSQKVDYIAYINENVKEGQIQNVVDGIKNIEFVTEVNYINKAAALEKWKDLQTDSQLQNVFTSKENPFPRSIEVKMSNPEKSGLLNDFFESKDVKPLISKTTLGKTQSSIDKLVTLTKTVKKSGWFLSGFFLVVSILIVYNTIRLAIFSRKDEIEIMSLVGASPSSVRWPFVIEGILYALIGALITILLIFGAFKYLSSSNIINSYFSAQYYAFFLSYWWKILLLELGLAIIICVSCSMVAVRKHIKI